MPNGLRQELLAYNAEMVELFHAETPAREALRKKHPTHIITFECMDGRSKLSQMAKLPKGFIRPRRNIGGKFRMGWPTTHERTMAEVRYAYSKGRNCLFISTYHFSESNEHLGCAGFKYVTADAAASSRRLTDELNYAYRGINDLQSNYAIQIGIETDREAFLLHSADNTKTISLTTVEQTSDASLFKLIQEFYPDMPHRIMLDLAPILRGNIERIRETVDKKPAADLDHKENLIFFGYGFDWFKKINVALKINDDDPHKGANVAVAANIVLKNRDAGRISDAGALVLVSVPYYDTHEREASVLHAKYLTELAKESIEEAHGPQAAFFVYLTCVMQWKSRRLEIID
jgi:hypothetical protein